MALNLKYSTALKNARLNQITTQVGVSGLLRIYDGAQPASPDTAVSSQVKLAELPCSAAFAPGATGGVLTANAIAAANALASGTASWFRLTTSAGVAVMDGTVGTSAADAIIDNTVIAVGQNVSCTSLVVTGGN